MSKNHTARAIAKILDEYANDETRAVFDNQADNIDDEASYIAERLKFYIMETDNEDFCKGYHTLKEWVGYGFNKVRYDGRSYWDGMEEGENPITNEQDEEYGLLEMDYWDTDEDGYKFIVLKKAEE